MRFEQIVNGYIAGYKREPIEQFKPSLAQVAGLANAGDTQSRLVNQLQSQSRLHALGRLLRPAAGHIPGPQAQMLRNQ
jgi:hypothetical protein